MGNTLPDIEKISRSVAQIGLLPCFRRGTASSDIRDVAAIQGIKTMRSLSIFILFSFVMQTNRAEANDSINSYGLLVGSNLPGENQEALKFSHMDATRMSAVLSEMGGFVSKNLTLLTDPDSQTLTAALDTIQTIIERHQDRNEQSSFLFYYSGHARARSLSLGDDEVLLEEIRARLEKLPATVKIVILDACQTGAFSRIKGAEPSADFSHNSISTFNTSGMAVMASSTASELSQESDLLQGSFFTHHLTVGLRGAADSDRNGQVTLHEAYRYAYNHTLVATSGTAVGSQHVTLETDMKGKGEMVLTMPAAATARIIFPASLKAEILLYRADDRTILAEAHKAEGLEMGLAFPPDNYLVLVRRGNDVRECTIVLGENQIVTFDLARCRLVEQESVTVKHSVEEITKKSSFKWRPLFEAAIGSLWTPQTDAYYRTLQTFGYYNQSNSMSLYYGALAGVHVNRYLAFGAFYSSLDKIKGREIRYYPGGDDSQDVYWQSHRFGFSIRGTLPVFRDRLIPFVQLDVGTAVSTIGYTVATVGTTSNRHVREIRWAYALSSSAGLIGMLSRNVGLLVQVAYIFAPAVKNLDGDKHNCGGLAFFGGLHFSFEAKETR